MQTNRIDHGKPFDWGRTSSLYAQYRDLYPPAFYEKLVELGVGLPGQNILDLGTGTGVLPRNMARFEADWTGVDNSPQQIVQAKQLVQQQGLSIPFFCLSAEETEFPPRSFDVITACQCFHYFDHEKLAPKVSQMLKPGGRMAVLYLNWLPYEDEIAQKTEELVLKYNPQWTGGGETRHPLAIPEAYSLYFEAEPQILFDLPVPFTRESWAGRILACRGIGASLSPEEIRAFDREHRLLLEQIAPKRFTVLHLAVMACLKKKG